MPTRESPQLVTRAPFRRARLRIGRLWIDALTRDEALAELEALVAARRGGAIYTPNVDHIVTAERHEPFVRAYERASLTFADGVPVIWASWLLKPVLPAKLSGSDMVLPIAALAAARGWRVYLLGGSPGAADQAAMRLRRDFGVTVVGADDSRVPMQADATVDGPVIDRIKHAQPDLVFVGLGAPKQELFIDRMRDELAPAVSIGVGASIDFIAGRLKRSPSWMSTVGLEWLYRLGQEPRRLWKRYLIQDPRFALVVLRTLRLSADERVCTVPVLARASEPILASRGRVARVLPNGKGVTRQGAPSNAQAEHV